MSGRAKRPTRLMTTGNEGARPFIHHTQVKNAQALPHQQWHRYIHQRNNEGGKTTYQQSIKTAQVLRTAVKTRLDNWGKATDKAGGWGADLLVDEPAWTRDFLETVKPEEGQPPDVDGDDEDEEEEEEEEDDDVITHMDRVRAGKVWRNAKSDEERVAILEREMAFLQAIKEHKEAPADGYREPGKTYKPKYEKGKERQEFDADLLTRTMKAMPQPKEGESKADFSKRMETWLKSENPIPGNTKEDAKAGGVLHHNFQKIGGFRGNMMVKGEDESPADFAIRQKTRTIPWRKSGESKADFVARIATGLGRKPGETDDALIARHKELKESTTDVAQAGFHLFQQALFKMNDTEQDKEYKRVLEAVRKEGSKGLAEAFQKHGIPSQYAVVGANTFLEMLEGRGDLAFNEGRIENKKLVGKGEKRIPPPPELLEEDNIHKPIVRRKVLLPEGKATQFQTTEGWKTKSPEEVQTLIQEQKDKLIDFVVSIDELVEFHDEQIAELKEKVKKGTSAEKKEAKHQLAMFERDAPKFKKLQKALADDSGFEDRLDALVGEAKEEAKEEEQESESDEEGDDAPAPPWASLPKIDAKTHFLPPPETGETKDSYFERMNQFMARHAMGMEDIPVEMGEEGEAVYGKRRHAREDPARPGSLMKQHGAKEEAGGVGFISNREGAKKATTLQATAGLIEKNPSSGLPKPTYRNKLTWTDPDSKEVKEVPEADIFPVKFEATETFKQGTKEFLQFKPYVDKTEGLLPKTARAFIEPTDPSVIRIFAYDPPIEVAQARQQGEEWKITKINNKYLPEAKGLHITAGARLGRPDKSVAEKVAYIKTKMTEFEEEYDEIPQEVRRLLEGASSMIDFGFGDATNLPSAQQVRQAFYTTRDEVRNNIPTRTLPGTEYRYGNRTKANPQGELGHYYRGEPLPDEIEGRPTAEWWQMMVDLHYKNIDVVERKRRLELYGRERDVAEDKWSGWGNARGGATVAPIGNRGLPQGDSKMGQERVKEIKDAGWRAELKERYRLEAIVRDEFEAEGKTRNYNHWGGEATKPNQYDGNQVEAEVKKRMAGWRWDGGKWGAEGVRIYYPAQGGGGA